MLKIIIPLAGTSDFFIKSGYQYPKPLIEIKNKLMIEWVIEKAKRITEEFKFIFIIKDDDANKYHLDNTLQLLTNNCEIIKLKKDAKGALCSILMSIDKIHKNDSILIMNGDQILEEDLSLISDYWNEKNADAGILTFESAHPRWSYARIEDNMVVQTAEKNPISSNAIAGYYYFKDSNDFLTFSFKTIKNNVNLDDNYYISSVLNEYILENKIVLNYQINKLNFHSFYSPQKILEFEKK